MITLTFALLAVNPALTDAWAVSLGRTIAAVRMVEASGRLDPPPGDGGSAIGPLQIRPILIADVNRIYGTAYRLADRTDLRKSTELFCLCVLWYYPDGGPEQWSRCWNGGPAGPHRRSTAAYWHKVRRYLAAMDDPSSGF